MNWQLMGPGLVALASGLFASLLLWLKRNDPAESTDVLWIMYCFAFALITTLGGSVACAIALLEWLL